MIIIIIIIKKNMRSEKPLLFACIHKTFSETKKYMHVKYRT